jgi:hypothetical protein
LNAPEGSRRRRRLYLPYGVVLALQLISLCGFITAAALSIVLGVWPVAPIFALLSILHASFIVYLLKTGKQGWERNAVRFGYKD